MINRVDEISNIVINKNTQKQACSNANLFKQTLNNAFDRSGVSVQENISSAPGLKEISSAEWSINNSNARIENKTDRLLKMLDYYSLQLDNNEMPLKKIEPFMEEIKDSAGKLLKETESAKDADSRLTSIAELCAVTANNEYLKFQRGDYIYP